MYKLENPSPIGVRGVEWIWKCLCFTPPPSHDPGVRVYDTGLARNQREISRLDPRGGSWGKEGLDRDWKVNSLYYGPLPLLPDNDGDCLETAHLGKSLPHPNFNCVFSQVRLTSGNRYLLSLLNVEEAVFSIQVEWKLEVWWFLLQ
jgi:hypothetical protein